MKNVYVSDLAPGQMVEGETFAVAEVTSATDKNDKPYYNVTLMDKTGEVKGKIWSDNIPSVDKESLKVGKVVSIDARVEQFRGQAQLNILSARGVDEAAMDEYLETSMFDADEMLAELNEIIASISDKHIKQLLENVFSDPEITPKFKYWKAANSFHHAFRSGLLQHVLEMLAAVPGLERFFPDANFDLVRAGCMLHDIGKLREIDSSGIVSAYTTEGNLLGHILLGLDMVRAHYPEDMPDKLKLHLEHIIASHQGEYEYASPALPATLEAMIVYRLDGLSSDARKMDKGLREPGDEYGITQYNRWLNRWLWAGSREEAE